MSIIAIRGLSEWIVIASLSIISALHIDTHTEEGNAGHQEGPLLRLSVWAMHVAVWRLLCRPWLSKGGLQYAEALCRRNERQKGELDVKYT